jgi:hypothetical protein
MNQLEICNWLIENPTILHLANQMMEAHNSTATGSNSMNNSMTTLRENQEDSYRLFDEELKCLFLRSRFPPKCALEQLVNIIFGLEIYKKETEKLVHNAIVKFTDYRNKYNDLIANLVKDLRATSER